MLHPLNWKIRLLLTQQRGPHFIPKWRTIKGWCNAKERHSFWKKEMFQCTTVPSEKPSPSALPDAVIQFNPPRLSFNPNYALKAPCSRLLQSHNSWKAAVSTRRLMWWKRRQLQSHKTTLISTDNVVMKRRCTPVCAFCCPLMCVTVPPEPSEMHSSAGCFVLTWMATPFFSLGSVNDWHQSWAAAWWMNSSSSVNQRQRWYLQR